VAKLRDAAGAIVDTITARAAAAGVHCVSLVIEARPVSAILQAVEERHADLIVMGTHGRTGVERMVLGSVAESVLREATIPVLLWRGK
jgi:nucleotide-binding universal stress UspA family protein